MAEDEPKKGDAAASKPKTEAAADEPKKGDAGAPKPKTEATADEPKKGDAGAPKLKTEAAADELKKRDAVAPKPKTEAAGDSIKWFKPLPVKGDFSAETLDSYFVTVQEWIENDMAFLRKPINRWRMRSYWLRGLAFLAAAAGVLLPLPIMDPWSGLPDGLRMGYLAVILGGLVLLLDRVYNVSSSWVRLTLAEMQVKQIRYRLDLDWAKQRPALTADNGTGQGPILIDLLRTALDATHQIMEAQKTAWTTELTQAMDALRARLDADRASLEQQRSQRLQEEQRATTGAVNITIDKPDQLKSPLIIRVAGEEKRRLESVPAQLSVNGIPAGLQTISVEAGRATGLAPFDYSVSVQIKAGEAKAVTVPVQ